MEAVIDSVVINHLVRKPKKAPRGQLATVLDSYIRGRRLVVAIDPGLAIIDEWQRTAGEEIVKVLVTQWQAFNGLLIVRAVGRIPLAESRQLRQRGCDGTVDKLLIKVALVTADKNLVSLDSDFWDPKKPGEKEGNRNAPVARLLRVRLGITVLTLEMLMEIL